MITTLKYGEGTRNMRFYRLGNRWEYVIMRNFLNSKAAKKWLTDRGYKPHKIHVVKLEHLPEMDCIGDITA